MMTEAFSLTDGIGEIVQFPCREDNYGYLLADAASRRAVAIDTPDPEKLLAILAERRWSLTYVLNTHWHEDHSGGNARLKEATGAKVIAPAAERDQIPTTDIGIRDGTVIFLGALAIHAIDTAGHTRGHLSYHVPKLEAIFTGDALFSMGCGRLFEGSANDAWRGLLRLSALPDGTRVYCAHEYGHANAAFGATMEGCPEVQAAASAIRLRHALGLRSVPTTIGLERRTNPFLCGPLDDPEASFASQASSFARLRRMKDEFSPVKVRGGNRNSHPAGYL